MAILSSSGIYSFLCSCKKVAGEYLEHFKSGFAGYGWKIWERWPGKWCFEIDDMVVRGKMTVFEMIISKIRFIRGALGITQANGTVKAVADMEDSFKLTIDEEMSFVADDFIKCKQFSNGEHGYHVKVDRIEGNMIVILKSEFNKDADGNVSDPPRVGDELVQFGNETDQTRQSAIYLHADEGGQPSIDVMFGLKSKDWTGCVKTRVGGDIPGADGLKGFYCENGMIKGTNSSGHTVYCVYPDGSAMFGDGSAEFNTDRSGHIAGGSISWKWDETGNKFVCTMQDVVLTWDNLSDEVKDNLKGETGAPGKDGVSTNGADGVNGKDGISMIFKGNLTDHPANPQNGWHYKNTTDKKSYVYQDGTWYQMTIDGVDGANGFNGNDGLSIIWKGDSTTPPSNPVKNWVYRDADNGMVYVYNGLAWTLMVADGSNGTDGTNGTDGWSVFITYHDSDIQPATPVGNGTADGWHTAPDANCVWMSQKVGASASSGNWGTPIRIRGNTGLQGVPGTPGVDGKVLYTWIRYANNANGSGISNDPTGKLYIGFAYNKETATESNTPSDYMWSLMKGIDGANGTNGTNGVPGAPGADGKTTYTWIAYSDNAGGSGMYQIPKASTKYIGIAVNKDTATESGNPSDYTWSLFRGADGSDGKPGVDANLLPWVEQWNNNKTLIDGEYVVSPKMFSGTKAADGKLTGIAQGKECITIDGVKRTGIFALVDNEVVFELDPMTKKYLFKGRVEADEGVFNGSISTPFLWNRDIDFSMGCNYAYIGLNPRSVILPSVFPYIGTVCRIYDSGSSMVFVHITGNICARGSIFNTVKLHPGCIAQFISVDVMTVDGSKQVAWLLENASEFNIEGGNTLISKTSFA